MKLNETCIILRELNLRSTGRMQLTFQTYFFQGKLQLSQGKTVADFRKDIASHRKPRGAAGMLTLPPELLLDLFGA
jgi:hypothetical protein